MVRAFGLHPKGRGFESLFTDMISNHNAIHYVPPREQIVKRKTISTTKTYDEQGRLISEEVLEEFEYETQTYATGGLINTNTTNTRSAV